MFHRTRGVGKAPSTTISIDPITLEGHEDTVWSLVFLHDKVHIVSGSWDGMIRKWDYKTGQSVGEPWKGEKSILSLALSPDGQIIACGRKDGSVQLWDTNGQLISKGMWTGHTDWVRSLSWSPSGSHLASGSFDGTILVRSVESGGVEEKLIEAKQGWVRSVAYSPAGDKIASSGEAIRIWDSRTGELLVSPRSDRLKRAVISIAWASDGIKLYSACHNFVLVFDSDTGTELHTLQHDFLLFSIALSPKHNLLACVGEGGTAQLWDMGSFQQVHDPLARKEARSELHCVSFSPDVQYLAYGGYDNKITLWMVKDITSLPVTTADFQDNTSSSLNAGDTNLLEQSAVNDEQGCKNLYSEFFVPSSTFSLLSSPSNSSTKPRFRNTFHLQSRGLMRWKYTTQRHASSPTISEQSRPLVRKKKRSVNQGEKCGSANSFEDATFRSTQCNDNNDEQQGEHTILSPAELDGQENWVLWKSLFRKNGANKAPAKVTRVKYIADDSDLESTPFFRLLLSCGHTMH